MSTKGKTWSWSDDARNRLSEAKKGEQPEHLKGQGLKHGLSKHPSYNSWKKMMQRCYQEHNQDYENYGGRGIKVCEEWHDVTNFVADMGVMRKGFSLERVDVNGDYEPSNCCWLPHKFQGKNRRPWKHTPEGLNNIREARRKSKEK